MCVPEVQEKTHVKRWLHPPCKIVLRSSLTDSPLSSLSPPSLFPLSSLSPPSLLPLSSLSPPSSSHHVSRKGYLDFFGEQDTKWHKKYVVSSNHLPRLQWCDLVSWGVCFSLPPGCEETVCAHLRQWEGPCEFITCPAFSITWPMFSITWLVFGSVQCQVKACFYFRWSASL